MFMFDDKALKKLKNPIQDKALTPPNIKDLQINIEGSPMTGDKTT